jgi:prephenate dehydrogenase
MPDSLHPKKIAIIGLGLMGGSLGLAARRRGIEVAAYARSEASRKTAQNAKIADNIFDSPADAVTDADLIILCTPIFSMPELVLKFMHNLKAGAVITDVGSTKAFLSQKINSLLEGTAACFIGSHPMTGSEKSGPDAARADLYQDAQVIITPDQNSDAAALAAVSEFWQLMGANITTMTAEEHDKITARTSHLPHLTAAILMDCADRDSLDITPFCGPGIRDATRIAEGSPAIWRDIIESNRDAVLHELTLFEKAVSRLQNMLECRDYEAIQQSLAVSRAKRQKLDNA